MRRSENQSIYSALPNSYITYSSNKTNSDMCKRADKCVIRINKWNTKLVNEKEIYLPKIVSQIKFDMKEFIKKENTKIQLDERFSSFYEGKKDIYNFLEMDEEKLEEEYRKNQGLSSQIYGNIEPKVFYCEKCGKIKNLKNNYDIYEMKCEECNTKLKQYTRALWICACGNAMSAKVNEKYRYFPKKRDGFSIIEKGKIKSKRLCITCPECNNEMQMVNAIDSKAFFPKIIKSVNLIDNDKAKLCENNNLKGIEIILRRKAGEISKEEYDREAEKIIKEVDKENIEEEDGLAKVLKNIVDNRKNKTSIYLKTDEGIDRNQSIAYKFLEYDTIKDKIKITDEQAIQKAIEYGRIKTKEEITELMDTLGISNMYAVNNIEIINTAYGYTRKYLSPEDVPQDEVFKLRSFARTSFLKLKEGTIDFLNTRINTEGILIELDKKKVIEYIRNLKLINKKLETEQEINTWFIEQLDPTIIKKVEPINVKEGITEDKITREVYTLLHTISHMFLNSIGDNCGIDKDSLGEMIFLNVPAIFIYSQTIQGSVLGAFTDMFEKRLYKLLKDTYNNNKICIFDPLCMEASDGRCCACSYLNEVTCEHFNNDLSRRVLYGYKGEKENIKGFWEKEDDT